tara:strand:+ start:202 stop:798 length:597 start_codon:yes stop_codon:yes gene_type:complete
MSFRIEEKLFIKKENIFEFKNFLEKKSVKQIYRPRIIKSLYFDNVNLDMYTDSKEGLTPRKKIRCRNYPEGDDKKIYLEVKNSSVEGRFKTRKTINKDELNQKKISGILDNQYGICYPKLYVSYKREYSIINDVRISIDNDIEYQDYKTSIKAKDDNIIVELKTAFNKNLDELVSDFPIQRIRFSKYCFAVEKLYNFN